MKTRIAKLILLAVVLVTSVSGCASLSLKRTADTPIPVGPNPDALEIKFGVARLLERNGKFEQARRGYLEILSLQSHAPSLHRLGVTAIRQNRLDAGLDHLSNAIAAGNPTAELLGDYGYAQLLNGDLLAAESALKEAVSLDPSQKRNINNLAIAIGKQDRLRESFQLFRQVNREPEALANRAFLQAQAEDLDKAKSNYNRALELDPELEIAAMGLLEVHNHLESYGHKEDSQYSEAHEAQVASQSPVRPAVQSPTRPVAQPPVRQVAQPEARIVKTPQQPRPHRQRIVSSELQSAPQPIRVAAPPQLQPTRVSAPPQLTNSTDRLLASISPPVEVRQERQIPKRAPQNNSTTRRKKSGRNAAAELGHGLLQPPSFKDHTSSGVVLQASYDEPINQPPPE